MAKKQNKKPKAQAVKAEIHKVSNLQVLCEGNTTLKPYCKSGLRALKAEYSAKIKVANTSLYGSSVDFDEALKKDFYNENRWDYGFEYDSNLIFIEFHPAQTSEIDAICKKASFTSNWLKENVPAMMSLPKFEKEDRQFYWVASGKNDLRITSNSTQSKKLAASKIQHVGSIFDFEKLKKRFS